MAIVPIIAVPIAQDRLWATSSPLLENFSIGTSAAKTAAPRTPFVTQWCPVIPFRRSLQGAYRSAVMIVIVIKTI